MGMDLIALSENTAMGGYHVNFTGWGQLGDLFVELGCDVSSMTSDNDGAVVDATTATAWGTELGRGLTAGLIYKLKYSKAACDSGWVTEIHVEDTQSPVPLSTLNFINLLFDGDLKLPITPGARPDMLAITDGVDTYAWLSEVAAFFANSGGFEQW